MKKRQLKKYPKKYEGGGMELLGDAGGMASGMIPGMGFVNLAGNLKGNIDTLKSDTINKAGKAQAGLNIGADALGAAASIPTPATPFLKAAEGVVKIGSSVAGMFAKEKEPAGPRKFTSQPYGNFKNGGFHPNPSISGFGGGMTKLSSIPNMDIYQTTGKTHKKGGITTPDGMTEYETGETYLKFKDQGGYFLPKDTSKKFLSTVKRITSSGPMDSSKEFTLNYMSNQAMKENEKKLMAMGGEYKEGGSYDLDESIIKSLESQGYTIKRH